ncbi:hypothetical protein BTO05_08430 [Winogradskyella sp. PC-19]|uniref:DUF5687 family protein n=1 Tax=unclassified Winogradskyella TaxID=2615021 RepID=UPI000B3C9485|nr:MULTISPECIES: DUF5687 family protein [unclassified Winogradskyella]ARV09666.1 hypothetical protein BTO05_08430 [Winogradskyella sp. PC-19]RZN84160.1 MAG: hypothetical protein EVB12_00545 [Winogradskyella sp.]
MIKHFLNLEWKQYFRSSYWQKNIALNILLVFFALYMIGIFVFLGVFLFKILTKFFPEQDPFVVVNSFIFFWILGEIAMRFFLQKLPVMSVKPLLTLPIKRSTIVNFVLGKSALSFFNFFPLFLTIPFGISLISNGYPTSQVLIWLAVLFIISLIANFLNFILEAFSADLNIPLLPILILVGGLYGLDYFGIISFTDIVGNGLLAISNNPIYILIPLLILIALYTFNFKILRKKLFLDASLKTKVKDVETSDLSWTKRFGDIAPFMQLDLKLIWRNKRTKSMAFLMVIGLLYGLFFYPQPIYADKMFMAAFIGIFSTGFFLINFGQFIPAWDSGYYKMLMSQNIKYEQYLRSKWILMTMSVVIMFVLGIPYVFFGWKILIAHFAAAVYNVGVNTHVIMWGGSFNRKKIDLDKKAAFNYQGTGAVQWLIGIPLMLVPMALFGLLDWLIGFEVAVATLIILGVIGIILHKQLMAMITQKYLDSKYKMIAAFSKDS